MTSIPVPEDDEQRVRRLRRLSILDTARESFTDSVAASAACIAGVAMAGVSLVDAHRQWFKSACGMDVESLSRSMALCSHAVVTTEPLIVPNLTRDIRFAEHPLVVGAPGARFYAGFPIVVDGHAIGVVCVIDDCPRDLSSEQIARLRTLAAGTAAWLVRRASARVAA